MTDSHNKTILTTKDVRLWYGKKKHCMVLIFLFLTVASLL